MNSQPLFSSTPLLILILYSDEPDETGMGDSMIWLSDLI